MGAKCPGCCHSGPGLEAEIVGKDEGSCPPDLEVLYEPDTASWSKVEIGPLGTLNGKAPEGYSVSGNIMQLGLCIDAPDLSASVRFARAEKDKEELEEAILESCGPGGESGQLVESINLKDGYILVTYIPERHCACLVSYRKIGGLRAVVVEATVNTFVEQANAVAFCKSMYTDGKTKVFKRPLNVGGA